MEMPPDFKSKFFDVFTDKRGSKVFRKILQYDEETKPEYNVGKWTNIREIDKLCSGEILNAYIFPK